jgi:hypothetical protein
VSEETHVAYRISSPSEQIREEREKKTKLNPRRLLWPLSSWQDELMGVGVVHVAPEDPPSGRNLPAPCFPCSERQRAETIVGFTSGEKNNKIKHTRWEKNKYAKWRHSALSRHEWRMSHGQAVCIGMV